MKPADHILVEVGIPSYNELLKASRKRNSWHNRLQRRLDKWWNDFSCRRGWHSFETIATDNCKVWAAWMFGSRAQKVPGTVRLRKCQCCGYFNASVSSFGMTEDVDLDEVLQGSQVLFNAYCNAGGRFRRN